MFNAEQVRMCESCEHGKKIHYEDSFHEVCEAGHCVLCCQTRSGLCDDYQQIGAEEAGWQLYTEYRGDKPVAYRYGPSWVAQELLMEGGFKTPEEAKLRWLEWWEAHGK